MKKYLLLSLLIFASTKMFAVGGCAFYYQNDSINPSTITFTYNGWVGLQTYTWNFGDGVGTSTQENPVYTYSTPGNYLVTLNTLDSNGIACSSSLMVSTSHVHPA
jgi:hypothetical protein